MPEVTLVVDGELVECTVERDQSEWIVRTGGREIRLRLTPLEPGVFLLASGGRSVLVHAAAGDGRRALHVDGCTLEYEITRGPIPGRGRLRAAGEDLSAPMPGVVTQVAVERGDPVTAGQPLVIIEAMKMEHVVRAPRAGIVRTVRVRTGEQVESGAIVAEIGPAGPADASPPAESEEPGAGG